jgi:uncharacterized protein with PIN domain
MTQPSASLVRLLVRQGKPLLRPSRRPDAEQVEIARSAWRKYGKGRHPAGLNFGDCFAYALAKSSDESLLAKGEDFSLTDIQIQTL